ncbi:hypothetical protein GQ53DRAFT_840038 [Thozetella sp. PMI_491]|nr:hypothetical protein GQ53DRAFT_840038 [Thozetella sp. PMI_491]
MEQQDRANDPATDDTEVPTIVSIGDGCDDFVDYIRRRCRQPFGLDGQGNQKPYVTARMLLQYWHLNKIESILVANNIQEIVAERITKDYIRIFSILCYIRQPARLKDLMIFHPSDRFLPVKTIPGPWISSESLLGLYKQLYETQWRFVPHFFDSNWEHLTVDIPQEEILPIEKLATISSNDYTAVYRVLIHEDCHQLTSGDVVFKEFLFDPIIGFNMAQNEINTYVGLLEHTSEIEDGRELAIEPSTFDYVAQYFGSFARVTGDEQSDSKVIILEYAKGGTLLSYINKGNTSSQSEPYQRHLWRQLGYHTSQGLNAIHRFGGRVGGHGDLKGDNILYTGGSIECKHKPCFKLVDFGSSHLRKSQTNPNWRSSGLQGPANRETRPPEASDWLPEEKPHLPPFPTMEGDMWAFGCICSEMFVATLLGIDELKQYKKDRQEENKPRKQFSNAGYGTAFHGGGSRLATVQKWHNRALEGRRSDSICHTVSRYILDYLLQDDPKARKSAKELASLFDQLLPGDGPAPVASISTSQQGEEPVIEPATLVITTPLSGGATEIGSNTKRDENTTTVPKVYMQLASGARHIRPGAFSDVESMLPSLRCINGRRHSFLIDDGPRMGYLYQQNACHVVRVISKLAKTTSPDGKVDLFFASSSISLVSRKSSELEEVVRRHTETSTSWALANTFGAIWETFILESLRKSPPIPTSLYILTDGAWPAADDVVGALSLRIQALIERIAAMSSGVKVLVTIIRCGEVTGASDTNLRKLEENIHRFMTTSGKDPAL